MLLSNMMSRMVRLPSAAAAAVESLPQAREELYRSAGRPPTTAINVPQTLPYELLRGENSGKELEILRDITKAVESDRITTEEFQNTIAEMKRTLKPAGGVGLAGIVARKLNVELKLFETRSNLKYVFSFARP